MTLGTVLITVCVSEFYAYASLGYVADLGDSKGEG